MIRAALARTGAGEAVWQDVEYGAYEADLPLWRKLAHRAGVRLNRPCEVLELGCGNGRVCLALARAGHDVTGLDVDPEPLGVLRRRAQEQGLEVRVELGDVRKFQLERHFDLVLAPMQLAQLLLTAQERLDMLCCVARHLRPQALTAVTLFDLSGEVVDGKYSPPSPDVQEIEGWVYSSQPVAVNLVRNDTEVEMDRVRRVVSPEGMRHESFSHVRLTVVSPVELERTARLAGLSAKRRLRIPATRDHTASAVVVLGRTEPTEGERGADE